jgi:hypothetical protein
MMTARNTATWFIGWFVWLFASCSSSSVAQIVLTSGNGQTGTVGSPLPLPLVVTTEDDNADALSGVTVDFEVLSGGGSVSPTSMDTDGSGQAMTTLTLGTTVGRISVQASAAGTNVTPIVFTEAAAAPAARVDDDQR